MKRQCGVTLVEVMMAVVIGSLLSVALTRLFSSGLKISQKGAAHLTNVQNAGILAGQIERDLERAEAATPGSEADGEMALDILTPEGPGRVTYRQVPGGDGIVRNISSGGPAPGAGEEQTHVFCRGLATILRWRRADVEGRIGYFVKISVRTAVSAGEEYDIERFIYCPNHPDNRAQVTGDWRW